MQLEFKPRDLLKRYSGSVAPKPLGISQEKSSITQASVFFFSGLPTIQFLIAYSAHTVSDQKLDGGEGLGTVRPQLIQVFFLTDCLEY